MTRFRGSMVLSLLAILVCGGLGAFAGVGLAEVIGLGGTARAIVAALIAMAVATLLWAAGVALLRVTGRL